MTFPVYPARALQSAKWLSDISLSALVQSAYDTTTPRRNFGPADRQAAGAPRLDPGEAGRAPGGLTRGSLALRDGPGAAERADDRPVGRAIQAGAARADRGDQLPGSQSRAAASGGLPLHRGRIAACAATARHGVGGSGRAYGAGADYRRVARQNRGAVG